MKKLIFVSLFVFLASLLTGGVYAQETTPSYYTKEIFYDWGSYYQQERVLGLEVFAQGATSEGEPALPELTGLLPDNPLYFLKTFRERLGFFFVFDPLRKEELRLRLAEERVAEYQGLVRKGKIRQALASLAQQQVLLNEVESKIEEFKEKGQDISELARRMEEQVARHEMVMEQVLGQVPEEARPAIEKAITNYQKHMDVVADIMGKDPIPPAVKARLEALKQQGILTVDEVTGLYSLSSRREVRERMKALREQGFLPKADFDKLNEAQGELFERAFEEKQERDKFNELEEIENNVVPPEILEQIEAFRKIFKPSEPIPQRIRQFLPLVLRKEELKQTLRPDMIDEEKLSPEEREVLEKFRKEMRPTKEEIEEVKKWEEEYPRKLPPERLQRTRELQRQFRPVLIPTPVPQQPQSAGEQPASPQQAPAPTGGSGSTW